MIQLVAFDPLSQIVKDTHLLSGFFPLHLPFLFPCGSFRPVFGLHR